MKPISRDELKTKLDHKEDLVLVEVLGPDQYQKFHLPGAINVPVSDGFEQKIQQAVPDKDRQVVVYCFDKECTASPKAAHKMDELGYQTVYDYEEGKMDWKNAGLPVEG